MFTQPAIDSSNIVLVDSDRLAELMVDNGLGVNVVEQFTIHELGEPFFEGLKAQH